MKKIIVTLGFMLAFISISNNGNTQPIDEENAVSNKETELSSWFNRCRNKLSHKQRQNFLSSSTTGKEIFLRFHCMNYEGKGVAPPAVTYDITPDRQLKLDYIKCRSKQGGYIAGGVVFLVTSIGSAISTGFAYHAYDAAPDDIALKDRMLNGTVVLGITTGVSFIASMIFFGASHKYRMKANDLIMTWQVNANGISGTF